jgi:hypothetical protein
MIDDDGDRQRRRFTRKPRARSLSARRARVIVAADLLAQKLGKGSDVITCARALQRAQVAGSIPDANDHPRISAGRHENIHQEAGGSAIAV